jgi:hypothetical protein
MDLRDRRLGALGQRVNHCRERVQIIWFCVRSAERPMMFTGGGPQHRRRRWSAASVAQVLPRCCVAECACVEEIKTACYARRRSAPALASDLGGPGRHTPALMRYCRRS